MAPTPEVTRRAVVFAAVVASVLGVLLCAPAADATRLTIVHDGGVLGVVPEEYVQDVGGFLGGMARIKTLHDEVAAGDPADTIAVKVAVGHLKGVSLFAQFFRDEKVAVLLNELGFEVTTLGQQDLFSALDDLSDFLGWLDFPMVVSNVQVTAWHALHAQIVTHHVVTHTDPATDSPFRIGYVGVVGEKMCQSTVCAQGGAELTVTDPAAGLAAGLAALASEDVHLVVLLVGSALSLEEVDALVAAYEAQIDVVVAGDTIHFGADADYINFAAASPYPRIYNTTSEAAGGKKIPQVAVTSVGRYVGFVRLEVEGGEATSWAGSALPAVSCGVESWNATGKCVEPDAALAARIAVWEDEAAGFANKVVSVAQDALFHEAATCRFEQCSSGVVVAEALRWKMNGLCDAAVFNAGAVRAGIAAGNVTIGAVAAMVPFPNTISVFRLRGDYVIEMLEEAIVKVPVNSTAEAYTAVYSQGGTGGYLQMTGIQFSFDPQREAGQRVTQAAVINGAGEYARISTNKMYNLCANDYLRLIGSDVLRENAVEPSDFGPTVQRTVIEYFVAHPELQTPDLSQTVIKDLGGQTFFCNQGCVHGVCVGWDSCECSDGWTGTDCNAEVSSVNAVAIALPVAFGVVLLGAAAYYLHVQSARRNKESTRKQLTNLIDYNELHFEREIGAGSFGVIFSGTWRGTVVAIKKVKTFQGIDPHASIRSAAPTSSLDNGAAAEPAAAAAAASSPTGGGDELEHSYAVTVNKARMAASQMSSMKKTSKQRVSESEKKALSSFHEEVGIMCSLRHPNVVLYMGTTERPTVCIITEFMPRGSLFEIIHNRATRLDWSRRINFARDSARGMQYLHSNNPAILHCDLKSPNVLVDANWVCKLCDFGMTSFKADMGSKDARAMGSLLWIGPEVLQGLYNEASDVYSYGICLYEIASRLMPYQELVDKAVPASLIAKRVQSEGLRPTLPNSCPSAFRQLAERCWTQEHHQRPTFDDIAAALDDMSADTQLMMAGDAAGEEAADLGAQCDKLKLENKQLQEEVTDLRRQVDELKDQLAEFEEIKL